MDLLRALSQLGICDDEQKKWGEIVTGGYSSFLLPFYAPSSIPYFTKRNDFHIKVTAQLFF